MAISTAKGIVKECGECGEVLPLADFTARQGICKPCRRDRKRAERANERAAGRLCDVWLVCANGECAGSSDRPFEAVCLCGHVMAGMACAACLGTKLLGCLTCWREKRHKCVVTFRQPALVVAS